MRLIDADEALRISKEGQYMWVHDLTDLEEFLTNVPTVEAFPIELIIERLEEERSRYPMFAKDKLAFGMRCGLNRAIGIIKGAM